jgi:hypothetical protein
MQTIADKLMRLCDSNVIPPMLANICDSPWNPTEMDMGRLAAIFKQIRLVVLPKLQKELSFLVFDTKQCEKQLDAFMLVDSAHKASKLYSKRQYKKYKNVLVLGYFFKRRYLCVEKMAITAEEQFIKAQRDFLDNNHAVRSAKELVNEVKNLACAIESTLKNGTAIIMDNHQQV